MKILIYKRTHTGDPDPSGRFGIHDCMGTVRNQAFDAVIGVGGIGSEPRIKGIAGKMTWVGIGPHKFDVSGKRGLVVTFEHFLGQDTSGPDFRAKAPILAEWIYSQNIRHVIVRPGGPHYVEALSVIRSARDAPPSRCRARMHGRNGQPHTCTPTNAGTTRTQCSTTKTC